MGKTNKYPVLQLANTIKQVLSESFKGEYWVYGELNGYKKSSGHAYPSICQRDDAGNIIAKIDLCIFRQAHNLIQNILANSIDGFILENGLEVCFKLKPDFYQPYGTLRGIVSTIDPLHTIEAAKKKRLAIVHLLEKEGILDNNKRLPLPPIITNIGLVTARKSAAEEDFINELKLSGYSFKVFTAYATMQGQKTEQSVFKALSKLITLSDKIDVICISRGGGDTTDLQWLDNETIARLILSTSIPICTGIGHEIDRCVLDDIARESHKTPTALAAAFIERINSYLHILHLHKTTLQDISKAWIQEQTATISGMPNHLIRSSQHTLHQSNTHLIYTSTQLKSTWGSRARNHYLFLQHRLAGTATRFKTILSSNLHLLNNAVQQMHYCTHIIPPLQSALVTDTLGLKKGSHKILRSINLIHPLKQIHLKWMLAYTQKSNHLTHAATIIHQTDPLHLLKRGYTITTTHNGDPLTDSAKPGDKLLTRTYATIITSTITEKKNV